MPEWTHCPFCGTKLDPSKSACSSCGAARPDIPTAPGTRSTAELNSQEIEAITGELSNALAPGIQLLRPLGQGGMGVVFLGRDPSLRRMVVIKVLAPTLAHDATARARFAREAEAAAAVSHPNVVSVYQVGELPRSDTSYFVMQHIDGPTLADEFPSGSAASEARAKRIVGETASALAAAHQRDLVHRDIKPGNIMIDRGTGRVVVLDFGISAAVSQSALQSDTKLTAQGTSIGTPQYMSPEQAAGDEVTGRSDVYSLGLVAFELLTGRPAFEADTPMAMIAAHLKDQAPPVQTLRPDLDTQFAALVDRCLEKDPTRRPSADEISRYLVPAPQPVIEWPPPGLEPVRGAGWRLLKALGAGVALGSSALLVLSLQPTNSSAAWFRGEHALPWVMLATDTSFDSTPLWLFLIVVLLAGVFGMAGFCLVRGSSLAVAISAGRRSGYPWSVLFTVATDRHADTEALHNGSGAFALWSEKRRSQVLRLRSWRVWLLAAAMVLLALSPLTWLVGWTGGIMANPVRLLPGSELLVTLLPGILLLATTALLVVPEIAARRKGGVWRPRRGPRVVRPELVVGWLRTAGVREGRPQAAALASALSAVPLVIALASLVVLLLTGVVVWLSLSITSQWGFWRGDARAWLVDVRRGSLTEQTWPEGRATLRAAVVGVRRAGAPDLEAARLLFRVALPTDLVDHPVWASEIAELGVTRRTEGGFGGHDVSGWSMVADGLSDSVRSALAQDTLGPVLDWWRRMAVSQPYPPLWYFGPDLSGFSLRLDAPFGAQGWGDRRYYLQTWERLSRRNHAAAILALARGDKAAAIFRMQENLSVALHLMSEPVHFSVLAGEGVARLAVTGLREIATITEDSALLDEADRMERAVETVARQRWRSVFGNSVGMAMADPRHPPGLAVIGDTTIVPVVRWSLLKASVTGFCYNPREVFFGVSDARLDLVGRAADEAGDLPRIDTAAARLHEWVQTLIEAPGEVRERLRGREFLDYGPIERLGVGIRLAICDKVR